VIRVVFEYESGRRGEALLNPFDGAFETVLRIALQNGALACWCETEPNETRLAALRRKSEDTVARAPDELAHLRGRVAVLEKALRDVRDLAGDRERFVMLGPRAFVAAVRIVDAVLGSADPGKPVVQP
jgi:hypothetical protein